MCAKMQITDKRLSSLSNRGHKKYIKFSSLFIIIILSTILMMACGGGGAGEGPQNNINIMDTELPSVPAGLTLTVGSSSRIDLGWGASSDNFGVTGYRIFRDNTEISTASSNSFSDSELDPGTMCCYQISAYDASGNESARSVQSCVTTDSVQSTWTVSTIDTQGDVGLGTSISAGPVHISYYDSTNNQLKYTGYSSGEWSTPLSLIDMGSISLATTFTSISTDSSGDIYISFYDATAITNGDLILMSCASSTDCSQNSNWSNITIDSSEDVGSDTSMDIDMLDNIHISYYNSDNGDLRYASCQSGDDCNQESSWTTLTVDDSGDVGQFSSIAVDSDSNIHISYYDSEDLFIGNLKYASCSMINDCTLQANWNTVVIDSSGDIGQYSSIDIDSANNIHISYYDFDNGNLKYAVCQSSSDCSLSLNWNTVIIDNAADVGDYSSIAIDSLDNLHISYHDFNNDTLKYAMCYSTDDCTLRRNWEKLVVDDTANVGEFSSIAFDENDNIHISYYDSENEDLKYAVKQ